MVAGAPKAISRIARLWEIAENLHRAELTVLEHDEHVSEWVRLTEEREVSAQVAPKLPSVGVGRGVGGGRPESGINAAVRELGIDRTGAQRAVKVASISEQAKAAAREAGRDEDGTLSSAVFSRGERVDPLSARVLRHAGRRFTS
ncbi:hypothetical protein [Siculibacillus lacustris]|uniref:hypothetical protein n=1 Tax=Siculibacillus lacustris TaxID=1549641 RepID=UPI00103E287D|nr:hypothetical protein [Siculibacillus lacustris]